ncbi:chromatin assembly factor 1 subunit A-A [Wyeomyia smithii]|uniref:chromatin assembly factor 1 subunit A-A n=1 Tax=Wyeomyia smithii TaxID=174621 RepID=UPI00246806CC|nr:chromatin assembly factor 1 subunit A-A [Wyeomyia smithii]
MMESVISDSKQSPSADGKKLKQSRLPFQVLPGSPASPGPTIGESRKRKPSVDPAVIDGGTRAAKIGRISEVKENVKDHVGVPEVVVLDDESNSADIVDVCKEDKKLVIVKVESPSTAKRNEAPVDEECGETAKTNDKIMIKFPLSNKKKDKKDDKVGKEEGPAKKKVHKEKKKQKKETKPKLGEEKKSVEQKPTIIVDDSDLSDGGMDDDKEAEESIDKMKDKGKEVEPPEDTADHVEPVSKDEKSQEQQVSKPEIKEIIPDVIVDEAMIEEKKETEEPKKEAKQNEVVNLRRGRSSRVKKSKTPEKAQPKESESVELPPQKSKSSSKTTSVKKNASKKEESPKTTKAPTDELDKKQISTESSSKTTSVKKNASKKEESPKATKAPTDDSDKKQTRGALDKFFAKVDATKAASSDEAVTAVKKDDTSTEKEPAAEINQKTPEKVSSQDNGPMETDGEPPGETKTAANSSAIISICLEESSDGNMADDEENAYMLCTPNTKERMLLSAEEQKKKLTPKQLARRAEAERKQALKQQELEEKKRKKQEEKDARQREREEQERLKKKEREEKEEQKKKEREEKEEQKRKEREEKEKKRLAELEAKNEEKRKRDEQKEEERRKKEEEKEAEEKRKQKTAQAFQSFFVKKTNGREGKQSEDENSMDQQQLGEGEAIPKQHIFMPFCVKGDMRLAPLCRCSLGEERKKLLDEILKKSNDGNGNDAEVVTDRKKLYLAQLKNTGYRAGKSERTWIAQDDEQEEDDVIVIDDTVCHQIEVDPAAAPAKRYRAKYFLFEENRRPPYLGTWRKRSAKIQARRPFAQDTKFFDYEVDSDDEWEEEEPGESLHGSDDEKDVDPEEDYEVDNDFFVPHGHLSDEEMQAEDDVLDDNSPETQKAKLKILQLEFAAEMKKKTEKIKPRLIGCIWENPTGSDDRPECSVVIWDILKARAMLFDPEEPISFTVQKTDPDSNQSSPSKEKESVEFRIKKVKLVDEGVKELIQLVHGCAHNKQFLVKEFQAYWAKRRDEGEFGVPLFAPESIRTKMVEICSWRPCPDEGPMQNKMCWYVHKEVLKKYQLTDISIPTEWEFILKPIAKSKKEKKERKTETEDPKGVEKEEKTPPKKESSEEKEKKERLPPAVPTSVTKPKTPAASITKFTKKLSDDDKRKQFGKNRKSGEPSTTSSSNNSPRTKPVVAATKSNSKASPKVATNSPTAAKGIAKANGKSPVAAAVQQPKKRIQLLMSVPKGQPINESLKNNLISQFLGKGGGSKRKPVEPMEVDPPSSNGADEVIVLDD